MASEASHVQSRIEQINRQIESTKNELEEVATKIRRQIETFAIKESDRLARSTAEEEHPHAQKLGADGLRKLRDELEELKERLPELIATELKADGVWPHRWERPSPDADFLQLRVDMPSGNSRRGWTALEGAFRLILGHVGILLQKHGFEGQSWQNVNEGRVSYSYGTDWPDDIIELLRLYSRTYCDELVRRYEEITAAEKELEKAKVRDLWKEK